MVPVAVLAASLALGGPAPDLVPRDVTATLVGESVVVSATVENQGARRARSTVTRFHLSRDATLSADDLLLVGVGTPGRRPDRKARVQAAAVLPAGLAPGTYRVLACADATAKVRERREANNCRAGSAVVVPAPQLPPVTVTWRAASQSGSVFIPVTATASGGTCTTAGPTGSCTVAAGASTVTLVASPGPGSPVRFTGWSAEPGSTCAGTAFGTQLTITDPLTAQGCVANYLFEA